MMPVVITFLSTVNSVWYRQRRRGAAAGINKRPRVRARMAISVARAAGVMGERCALLTLPPPSTSIRFNNQRRGIYL